MANVFPDVALRLKEFKDIASTNRANPHLWDKISSDATYLEAALLEFRSLQNSCVAILRMPPEVLAQITDYLVKIWPARLGRYIKRSGDLGWITLSHICRQLREVLLGKHELWAQIIYTFPRARDLMLVRAGDLPVSLRLSHATLTSEDIDFVFQHLGKARVVEIDVSLCNSDDTTWILEPAMFSQKMLPALEELTLYMDDREEQLDLLTSDVWELPPSTTPRLRTLYLHCMAVPFNPATLTKLTLHFDETPPYLYTPAHFLDLLRQCTLLQEIELTYAVPSYPLKLNGGHPVELPALSHLQIGDDVDVCIGFWNHISVPSSCTAVLHLHQIQDHYPDFCSHLHVIPARLKGPAFEAPIVGLSVWDAGDADSADEETMIDDVAACWLVFDLGMVNPSWTGVFKHNYKERMSLYMYSIETTEPHFVKLLAQALKVVDAGQIQILEIGSKQAHNMGQWSRALTPFNNLHTLYLENMPRTPLLLSLAPTAPERQDFTSIILPGLRFLWLDKLDLSESDKEEASPVPDRVQFIRTFLSRKQQGFPVQHLRIGELRMDVTLAERSFLPRIRAIVPLVECNTVVPPDPVTGAQ
ncbi:hypothetical protein PENSPDRAFT_748949 [Peniophora sp. CONT]|nr:hypothetical protein PENSPDRAFT_748949 [Peniophora sp. CONT]